MCIRVTDEENRDFVFHGTKGKECIGMHVSFYSSY